MCIVLADHLTSIITESAARILQPMTGAPAGISKQNLEMSMASENHFYYRCLEHLHDSWGQFATLREVKFASSHFLVAQNSQDILEDS